MLEAQVVGHGRGGRPSAVRGWPTPRIVCDRSKSDCSETKGQLSQATAQNEKLSYTLREAREHIASLRDEVDKLTQPPNAYGVVVGKNDDGTVDVLTSGRKMKVQLHPDVDHELLDLGAEVALNESFAVIDARRPEIDR